KREVSLVVRSCYICSSVNGQELDPLLNLGIKKERNNGSFEFRSSALAQFQGKYQCYASNKLGTAVSEEIKLIVSNVPKFPKEKIDPIVVEEGQPIILECNPPQGISPRQIYWMSINLQHIEQDERVSMGMDGNLYFSNALLKDSRSDYCCFAYFSAIRTIVQKTAMSVVVKSSYTIQQRIPRLLTPPGVQSEVLLVKGEELVLECISEGFPTSVMNWKKMGEELPKRAEIKNYGKLLTISKVEEKDNGKYRCKANNSIGDAIHDFIVTVEDPPRWQPEPPRGQLAVIGSEVNIKCSASGKPKPVISWRRNGQPLDDGSLERQVFDDTLVLHRARPEDSAVYQCEASNRHGTILANVNVMIMNSPPRILTKDNQRYLVVRGRKVVMDCKVFSSPPSDVSWKKHGTVESVKGERFSFLKNGSLLINQTEKEDSGEYVCSATSSDKTTSIKASLDVKDATKIVEQPQDQQIIRGTTAQLPCQAEYDTSLRKDFEIVWSKDENEITAFTEQSRYSLVNGTLQIIDVNRSDEGAYTCIARTNLDQDSASARVTVLDVPDAPEYLELSEEKSRSVRLAWVPGDAHNSSVTEFIVEYEENQWNPGTWRELQRVPGNQNTVKLALQGNLNYQFRMCAVNAIGKGPPSRPTDRYKTPPAAPDKNPENIKIEGHLPHQLDISWEPLLPMEHNGPGLEFKVSYRRVGLEYNWTDHLVRRPSIVVKNTPTFVPYEIKIQSRNSHGWGPEPKVVTGYSGEDCDSYKPPHRMWAVEVINTTVLRVSWTRVVHWVRKRSLLHSNRISEESQSLTFPGNRSHAIVSDLKPFSEYRTDCERSSNKKGNGPSSDAVIFQTPEGVPEEVPILTASNAQTDSITLVWGPPFEANGILTGYRLQYQPGIETLEVGNKQEVNISGADTTQWLVQGLEDIGGYMFYLSACTKEGCGPPRVEEGHTITETYDISLFNKSITALFNISSYVSDTFAKISWTAKDEQQESEFYISYMNNRESNWRISEAVNTSKGFHMIEGLDPGTKYTVRLVAKSQHNNASIFEDVIQTRVKELSSVHGRAAIQPWIIGMMCAVALLTVAVLMACFVFHNQSGKYAVKEREDLHPEVESQSMSDDTSEISDEKPLKSHSLDWEDGTNSDSVDSLVDYGDEEESFNEDGSFIGEYSSHKKPVSLAESNGQLTA
uniref:protein-tyrosine-phosphatase n=1 Tax=Esox lucius TaxID=8010 RepID=A0A6Q2Y6D1_ESOLU